MVDFPSFEHINLIENLPIIGMFAVLFLMIIPVIPASIKTPLIIGGMIVVIGLMFTMDKFAQVEAAVNNVFKARIRPYNIECEFHVKKTIGRISSRYNPATGKFITPFKLAEPKLIKELGIGAFEEFELEHKLQFDTRNHGDKAWIHWKGIETEHANTYLVDFWYMGARPPKVGSSTDFLGFVPRFQLAVGTEDYHILKGKSYDEEEMREPTN